MNKVQKFLIIYLCRCSLYFIKCSSASKNFSAIIRHIFRILINFVKPNDFLLPMNAFGNFFFNGDNKEYCDK